MISHNGLNWKKETQDFNSKKQRSASALTLLQTHDKSETNAMVKHADERSNEKLRRIQEGNGINQAALEHSVCWTVLSR